MVLVSPYFVSIVAVGSHSISLLLLVIVQKSHLCKAYTIAFNQALSYAFVTSRKVINTSFFLLSHGLNVGVDYFQVVRCGRAFFHPPWHSDMLIFPRILLFIILSNNFPRLLLRVMPLSLLHSPFFPFPLYFPIILPCLHLY